ncbi:MAG: SRPBCC family protein [Nitrososphaerota archaeon]|nr:SRPBCC family protein [Nitrososphaerota archaeon]
MHFEETLDFEGDPEEVWRRASNVAEIPRYWHGTRSIEAVGAEGGKVHVKVEFAFGGRGEADIVTDEAGRTVTMEYRSGPFTGRQTVAVSGRRLVATWDVRFRGFFRLASRWNEGHFRSGTRHALERLAAGAPRGEKV